MANFRGGAVTAQEHGGGEETILIDRHQRARSLVAVLDDLLPDFHGATL